MMRFHLRLPALFLLGAIPFAAQQPHAASIVSDLLSLPAPAPPAGLPSAPVPHDNAWNAPTFGEPPADAPFDVLGPYWAEQSTFNKDKPPSSETRARLLLAVQQQPQLLPELLVFLPDEPQTWTSIRKIYDANQAHFSPDWRDKVRQHLEFHSDYFRSELIAAASQAHDAKDAGYVEKSDELEALAKLDWPHASPILQRLAGAHAPRAACLALTLQYRHAIDAADTSSESEYRTRLKTIIESRSSPGYCRNEASSALFDTTWTGRDEWYLSLFRDPTMRFVIDNSSAFSPLSYVVDRDPDHWIPVMTKLVASSDRATHDNAVEALVSFQLDSARKDALQPLLPWLFEPKWSSARDRLRLIQSVDRLEMTDSIPGLIAVLTEDGDDYDRSYAAESLAHFKDSRAVPSLRIALDREKSSDHRRRIIKALIACNGFSPAEAAQDIEDYAAFTQTAAGEEAFEESQYSFGKKPLPVTVAVGAELARDTPPDATAQILIGRATQLQKTHPETATHLRTLIATWATSAADHEAVRTIANGEIEADAASLVLQRRGALQASVKPELETTFALGGVPAGIAAVLLASKDHESAILETGSPEAKASLLAAARLVREPLPLDKVMPLLASQHPTLSAAAAAYLETEDSHQAREAVLALHLGEARILGARERYDPGHSSFASFDKLESQLRTDVLHAPPGAQIYALLSAGYWGNAGQIIIYVAKDKTELHLVGRDGKPITKPLPSGNTTQLLQFIDTHSVDDLGPLNLAAADGMQYEYIHLTRDGGRRVFMNNPGLGDSGGSTYDLLHSAFIKAATITE